MPKVYRAELAAVARAALNERACARTLAPWLRARLEIVRLSACPIADIISLDRLEGCA